jgi:Rps23 Pro-64 3,4-dihydroxylase Tpa1-like proline 4-hydroxylase
MQTEHPINPHSIEAWLNPAVRAELAAREIEIRAALSAGQLVVIRDAMQAQWADKVYTALDQFKDWRRYESYSDANHPENAFNYQHHNIYDRSLHCTTLSECEDMFTSENSKRLIEKWSGQTCWGPTSFSASWYRPGDHSTPHNDFSAEHPARTDSSKTIMRKVAYVWHLTRDWQPHWGGAFYWSPQCKYLPPSFNTLLLFVVGEKSDHCVTPVSPVATSKRLTINGWWHDIVKTEDATISPAHQLADSGQHVVVI